MRHFFFVFFIAVLAISCKKDKTQDNIVGDFAKGYVFVGIDSTLQLEQLFTNVNSFNLTINRLMVFFIQQQFLKTVFHTS
jgi:hypothetical protein